MATSEEIKLDNIEQYGRRQNLEFKGVPVTGNEDTGAIVVKLVQ